MNHNTHRKVWEIWALIASIFLAVVLVIIHLNVLPDNDNEVIQLIKDLISNTLPVLITVVISLSILNYLRSPLDYDIEVQEEKRLQKIVEKSLDRYDEFSNFRDSGIERICENYEDSSFLLDKIPNAKHRIYILVSVMEHQGDRLISIIKQASIKGNNCKEIRVLMLNPESTDAETRSADLGQKSNYVSNKFDACKSKLTDLKDFDVPISLQVYDQMGSMYAVICDDEALIGFFWRNGYATERPMLEVNGVTERNMEGSLIGKMVLSEFNHIWKNSKPIDLT